MFLGSLCIVLGTIVCGLTITNANVGQFMGGRFLLGFGVSIAAAAGPIYVVETTHPAYRGIVTGYCNTFWFVGSILSSGAVRGAITLTTNESWQIPIWLQMVFAGLIMCFCFLIPESPRWLYVHGKQEQAIRTLTKWHGYGNQDSVWVKLQISEYESYLNTDGSVSAEFLQIIWFLWRPADLDNRTKNSGITDPCSISEAVFTVLPVTVVSPSSHNGPATVS